MKKNKSAQNQVENRKKDRFSLSRETIRLLDPETLEAAKGAVDGDSCSSTIRPTGYEDGGS